MARQTKMEKLFLHAARMLNSTLEYEALMKLVMELTAEATNAEAAMVYRIDRQIEIVKARYCDCINPDVKYFTLPKGKGIIGWVAENREPAIVNDVSLDDRFFRPIEEHTEVSFKSVLAVPLIGRGQMIGVVEAVNKRDGLFSDEDLDTLVGLANQFAVAIDNANLYRSAKREATERRLLYEVGKKLSSTLNVDTVLKLILNSLRQVVGFDAGGVYLIDNKNHELTTAYAEGYGDESDKYTNLKFGQGLVGWVARTGESIIVPDVATDDRYVNAHPQTKSEIVTPLKIDGSVIGVMTLESNRLSAYDEKSLELLTTFASQAAISLERAVLHNKMLESRRIEEQLAIARQIQLSFLPKDKPDFGGYDITGVNIPSGEVGGDYYDFIKIIENQTGIAIADVSGKGIPAAIIMASFRASLIAEIKNNFAIRTICQKVNHLLYESVEIGNFVTAFYGVLDSKNDIFTFANCGHNRPIHIKNNGDVSMLKEGGPALGVVPDAVYEERPIFLQAGDLIFFYTDAVTETANESGLQFGENKLINILLDNRHLPAGEIRQAVYAQLVSFASEAGILDDLTMIVLKKL
jgi:sigma-B regulation protein RsbU (phosphoserine phosphatase)